MLKNNSGKIIAVTDEGFLEHPQDWDQSVAEAIAATEGIGLTDAHREIIYLLREFYFEYDHIPPLRILVKEIGKRLGETKGQSIYLYQLFPDAPLKRACRIAGIPKPRHCL